MRRTVEAEYILAGLSEEYKKKLKIVHWNLWPLFDQNFWLMLMLIFIFILFVASIVVAFTIPNEKLESKGRRKLR